jgi:hypothetical protein
MLGHVSAAMTLDVYAACSIQTSTTWPIGSTKRPGRRAVCPRCVPTGYDGTIEVVDEDQDDDGDGLGGVPARVG